jgi:hypothetical protein
MKLEDDRLFQKMEAENNLLRLEMNEKLTAVLNELRGNT